MPLNCLVYLSIKKEKVIIMHEDRENKTINNQNDQREFQTNFNVNMPINTQYKLLRLGEFEYSPTMEYTDNINNPINPNLTRVQFGEITDQFRNHQMDMHSGLAPIYAKPLHNSVATGIINRFSQLSSMERIVEGSYLDKTAKEILLPLTVRSIGTRAFKDFTNLKRIIIPEGVTEIGEDAFSGCSQLRQIVIPEGITKISKAAFMDCSQLSQIVIPEGVTEIGKNAFSGCSQLSQIVIPEGVTEIGNYAFWGCSQLRQIVIPESVTKIGSSAFWGCSQLQQISIPNAITEIPEDCFNGCTKLRQITFSQNLQAISAYAFSGCNSLRQLTFPDSLTSIRYRAFEHCTNLEQIITGLNLIKIGKHAFQNCPSLDYVYINSPNVCMQIFSFSSCHINHLRIPAKIKYINEAAFVCTRINNITVDYDNNNQVTLNCQNDNIYLPLDPQNPDKKILCYDKVVEIYDTDSVHINNYEPKDVEFSNYTDAFLHHNSEEEQEESIHEFEPNEPQNNEQQQLPLNPNLNNLLDDAEHSESGPHSDQNLSFHNLLDNGFDDEFGGELQEEFDEYSGDILWSDDDKK